MRLARVHVENYRGLRDVVVDLDDTTVLIGENNSGKTAFLEALRSCLERLRSRRSVVFETYDFHLVDQAADPLQAPPITITLHFEEGGSGEWSAELLQALSGLTSLRPDDRQTVILRVRGRIDPGTGDPVTEWEFLDTVGNPLTTREARGSGLNSLQGLSPMFYLSALRDAARHFDARGQFWRPFLRSGSIDETKKQEIETALLQINQLISGSHDSFDRVRENLKQVQVVIATGVGADVSIDAIPTRIFDMLSRAQVTLASAGGARLPVARHGEGTQSLAVLLLFSAFLQARLESEADPLAQPIIALEEPEAHLHPNAIRSLYRLLTALKGQKVIASHSGDLLSQVDIAHVRRFARHLGSLRVFRLQPNTLTVEEQRKFNYHVRMFRGESLFARCWLLLEGETEVTILPAAARALGYDLEAAGVRCVEFAKAEPVMFIKVANDLGIACHYVVDGDAKGDSHRTRLLPFLDGAPDVDHITRHVYDNFEHLLCEHGFGHIYLPHVSPQKANLVTANPGDPNYWRQVVSALRQDHSKPRSAMEVATEIAQQGSTIVPAPIKAILDTALALAKR